MKLKIVKRTAAAKNEAKRLRREGMIPVILYAQENNGETLSVCAAEFKSHLRRVKPGHLPTTVFTLVDSEGHERRALIKDIQYAVTTYEVSHLDFEELRDDCTINVKVPIECVGQAECIGIKLGGVLRQVIRHVRVSCLPKDIPTCFQLDVRELGLRQSKRLHDLEIPEAIRPLMGLNEVAAVIVKR